MSRRTVICSLLAAFAAVCLAGAAAAQTGLAKPGGPLTCHKEVCAQPQSSCQMLESQDCIKGGGPPRCPAIINVADGASCSDGNACTSGDVCTAGVCGGTPVVCSSPTDTCSISSGCATRCDSSGCVVGAASGYLNPTLTIPAGALSAPVNISMIDQGGDSSDSSVFHVYSFAPSGTTFLVPATVDLPAPPPLSGQVAVIEVSDDGVTWTAVATTIANGRASGPIAHFSKCRTRNMIQGDTSNDLIVEDVVGYQEAAVQLISTLSEPGAASCYSGDLFGMCVKIKNANGVGAITSNCPTPTPSPPPPGCHQLHVIPWQCSAVSRTLPPFDPANPKAYEGQHCDRDAVGTIFIPCPETIYNMDSFLPVGGLNPGEELWIDFNFLLNPPTPANGVQPYGGCIAGSGFFIGFDVLFREPSGTDWQAGIRSAKDGVFINVPQGTPAWLPAGVAGCVPAVGKTACPVTCTAAAGCSAEWDWLVDPDNPLNTAHGGNYPTLRCVRPDPTGTTAGTFINCTQYQPGDIADKNWFIDSAF
jgi:hypothetical protein